MHCVRQILYVCLVEPSAGGEYSVFKFADFITALALLVIVYTIWEVRYRFRLMVAPTRFHIFVEAFGLIAAIGFGTLLTDIWVSERWLVPESLITQSVWRGILGSGHAPPTAG